MAIIVSVNFVLATKELFSFGFLDLVPSTVFYLKINDVSAIILYLNMIYTTPGEEVEYTRTIKIT